MPTTLTDPLHNYGVTISEFGTAEVLTLQPHLPLPDIGEQQILLETHYAAINPVDYKTRSGLGWGAEKFKSRFPAVLGFDAAGVVAKAGAKSGFQVGERVAVLTFDGGAYSRYFAVNADLAARVPDGVSLQQAAALPTVGVTALQLVKQAAAHTGQKILISAPAGGVGHLAVQLLQQQSLEVIAICSPSKQAYLKTLGIDHFLDYTALEHYPALEADIFLDLVGGEAGVKALSAVKQGGRVICVPTIHVPLLQQAGASRHLQVEKIMVEPNAADLSRMLALLAAQKLQIEIADTYPLAQIKEAHLALEQGRTLGKIILDMEPQA
ncbi:quinone oxidoreductase [Chelonobacter oris]|uniref:Quinone oxidoreductase n=1 Tax=Chelonobacter oris TaxID=505317 RepID=A0A0A3BDD9_9PAST|nr:NADP-dependent oxidoreductase [Chelonobacter oris]KGQ71564.1 quinone oxidoreductase [Chelonobacter oris]